MRFSGEKRKIYFDSFRRNQNEISTTKAFQITSIHSVQFSSVESKKSTITSEKSKSIAIASTGGVTVALVAVYASNVSFPLFACFLSPVHKFRLLNAIE